MFIELNADKLYIKHFKTKDVDPYGTGETRPPIFGLGDIITNAPPNISGVISATFFIHAIFS